MVKIMNEGRNGRNGRKVIQEIMGQRMRQSKRVAIFYDLSRYFRDDVTAAAADVYITNY